MLEIKSFVSLKNEAFHFWTRVHVKRGVKFSKILRGIAHERGGGGSERFRIFEGLGKKG